MIGPLKEDGAGDWTRCDLDEICFRNHVRVHFDSFGQVRFSPLMTLPTTVEIRADGFQQKVAWSTLPGSTISVPAGQGAFRGEFCYGSPAVEKVGTCLPSFV